MNEMNALLAAGYSFSGNERHCAYLNLGSNTGSNNTGSIKRSDKAFANVSAITGFDFLDDGRALGMVDWDFDGDLDFWISNRTAPAVRFLRNDLESDHHFLKLRLKGNAATCNRDAIGARVTVQTEAGTLLRTLKAGEGYLSQSSKWLHFGLGETETVDSVTVQWPDGSTETKTNILVDQHLILVQGKPEVEPFTAPQTQRFIPQTFEPAESPETTRIVLSSGTPLPRIQYFDKKGTEHSLRDQLNEPLLLNLWASWCAPCLKELGEFDASDTPVLALCVNGIHPSDSSTREQASTLIESNNYGFAWGYATARTFNLLQAYSNTMSTIHQSLPAPTSFLVDKEGRVRVIYKGPVSPKTIREDIALIQKPLEESVSTALPYPGQWDELPPPLHPVDFAKQMFNENLFEEVFPYVMEFNREPDPRIISIFDETAKSLRAAGKIEQASEVEKLLTYWASQQQKLKEDEGNSP